jgi:hypothetical protein
MKTYYPETTIIKGLARVHRERKLPLHTAPKPTHTMTGMSVDAIHVVLEGDVLREYRILDAGEALGIRDPNQLAEFILVSEGQRVQYGQEIAQRGRGRRSKVLSAPADGEITRIEDTQIVLQIAETTIEVMAKIPGQIDEIEQYTVQITGHGALIQCAWGNGAFCYEAFRFVPEGGFVELSKLDVRISEYRRVVLISPNAISKGDLLVAQQQEVAGVVAPSMPSNLREFAMRLTFPVLLTEGFGRRRPTALIYSLLQSNMGRQAAFDAVVPDHWAGDRPEIMIPLPSGCQCSNARWRSAHMCGSHGRPGTG